MEREKFRRVKDTHDPLLHRDLTKNFDRPPAQKKAWQRYPYTVDKDGLIYFSTPAKNMEAAREIMEDDEIPTDEKVFYSKALLKKAEELQVATSSCRLADNTVLCKAGAGAGPPNDPSESSSHGKGKQPEKPTRRHVGHGIQPA